MIFGLHFALTMAGYSAAGILLGSYMIRYAGASELDLGFVFMIQPLAVFARPFICAQADRYQSHKKLLTLCLAGYAIAYTPFIIIPYLLMVPSVADTLTQPLCFWILVGSHTIGSFSFCGVRSLGDALSVNYAKRIGSDFPSYRKFGAISFGLCGYLLGQINQGWLMPDYVPSMVVMVLSFSTLMVLVYLWPDEFFVIMGNQSGSSDEQMAKLPKGKEIAAHMGSKLRNTLFFVPANKSSETRANNIQKALQNSKAAEGKSTTATTVVAITMKTLSNKQQLQIFALLIRYDIRIPLFLLLLVYGGMVGYAPVNFVFTWMDQVCNQQNICNAAQLAGLCMISYCVAETICYLLINKFRSHLSNIFLLELSLASLAVHYYFYGLLLPHLSPYFFLVESMHGLEYSTSLSTSMELAYKFANQVELLIPELLRRGIIGKSDDPQLVKVSLMATMNACFTLAYDGVGTLMGVLIYGIITDNYTFSVTWILVGTLATIGFFTVLIVVAVGKCFDIQPDIQNFSHANAITATV